MPWTNDYDRGKLTIIPGTFETLAMPHSEVCMHMRIAGKRMKVELLEGGRMVQLYHSEPGPPKMFSIPITRGEAGIYEQDGMYYSYFPKEIADGL